MSPTDDRARSDRAVSRLAIKRLEARAPLGQRDIDAFIQRHTFPIVEGPIVTFVYRGPADAVQLQHWIYGLPARQPFARIPDTDLWYLFEELPEGSRVEYKFEIVEGGTRRWIEDPLNPLRAQDPFGANSVCHAHRYVVPEWTRPDPEARSGRLDRRSFQSAALGGRRPVTLYLPARYRTTHRYPLLIVHDGTDYLRYSGLKTVLDNLIHRQEIPPLIAVLTDPGDRHREYANDGAHSRFLTDEIVPWMESEFPLLGTPKGRCLMGASMGAVASLAAAWRRPGFYGRLLLQSGAFAFTDIGRSSRDREYEPVVAFINALRERPTHVADRLFVSCGVYESLIYENRSLVPLLRSLGLDLRYVEARDGHNWENWRDRLREGLSWLLPGPLWMVYE